MATDNKSYFPILFLIIAFFTDLLTPFLISRGRIPAQLRWVSHGVIALIIFWVILRMLAFNRIPLVFWVIIAMSAIGFISALLNGQAIAATAWGWWLMFQFPMAGLFAYLQPDWPKEFPKLLILGCVAILGLEVVLQLYQYFRGTIPGDQLSGTFGRNGTGNLVLFIILVLSFTLGEWLATRRWIPLLLALVFGTISSTLGEMKIFLPAMILSGVITLFYFIIQAKELWKLIPYSILIMLVIIVFFKAYNIIIPAARQIPLEGFISDPQLLLDYLDSSTRYVSGQNYYTDIGRNFALQYGWSQISENPISMFFGMGLGARSESSALGLAGQGLLQGGLGISTGTSLLIIMQEVGLMGLIMLGGLILIIIIVLNLQIRNQPTSNASGLRYGIIIFSILWPLWLWYNTAWNLRVPMLCYWVTLGYLMSEHTKFHVNIVHNN